MKKGLLAGLIFSAGLLAAADGKTITSRTGCQMTVPTTWVVGGVASMADSPDKKANAVVSSRTGSSFATVKESAQMVYPGGKVTKDSATEFQMEGKSMNGKPNVYRAVPSGNKYCIAEVVYESGTVEDAKKIIETLK
jgi:hypothetical protein